MAKTIPEKLRIETAKKCNLTCQICGEIGELVINKILSKKKKPANFDGTLFKRIPMEIDHMKPISKGGKTELRNLQLLCQKCNRQKGSK